MEDYSLINYSIKHLNSRFKIRYHQGSLINFLDGKGNPKLYLVSHRYNKTYSNKYHMINSSCPMVNSRYTNRYQDSKYNNSLLIEIGATCR